MIPDSRPRLAALAAFVVIGSSCQSFDVERSQFAIIGVPTTRVEGGYTSRPSAYFFEGAGIRLATTQVGTEGCVERVITGDAPNTFAPIDAGDEIAVNLSGTDATLTPVSALGRVTYQLPAGASIPFTPGDQITVTIPGAVGAFPARLVRARTVEPYTPAAVTLPVSTAENLEVTWTPLPSVLGTAMFYSFKYDSEGSALFNREIACVFADDGRGIVPASMLNGFRASEFRSIVSQRALITIERIGSSLTHVTSTLSVPVELITPE